MEKGPKKSSDALKRRVRRYSVSRLLREKVAVTAGATVSTELHRGQLMVRVEPHLHW